jgi:CRISPR-associated protein Csx3
MVNTVSQPKVAVQLQIIELKGDNNQTYQTLIINLASPIIEVGVLTTLDFPDNLDRNRGLILYGKAPIWVYTNLIHQLADLPWLACFDIKVGAVIISSQVSTLCPGDILTILPNSSPGKAILIGGPPDSGKSVLANTLRLSLTAQHPEISLYLHRANWDGEGNHTYEAPDRELSARLKQHNKYPIHHHSNANELLIQYFKDQENFTQNIRQFVNLALVDVGGKPQKVKLPVIQQCTHCIIISRDPAEVQNWLNLCSDLTPIAVIHSVLEYKLEVLRTQPYLEIVAGKWHRDEMITAPDVLLKAILKIIDSEL